MSNQALNVICTKDAALNLHHFLAVSTGESDTSAPGVDITMRGDHHHYLYFEQQTEADAFFNRLVTQWQRVSDGVMVCHQVALLRDAIFSMQPTGEYVVIMFHHSEHRVHVGAEHTRTLYHELVAAWENDTRSRKSPRAGGPG